MYQNKCKRMNESILQVNWENSECLIVLWALLKRLMLNIISICNKVGLLIITFQNIGRL